MKTQAADQRAKDDQEVLSAYRAFEETELLNVRPFFWRENEKPRRVRSAAHTDWVAFLCEHEVLPADPWRSRLADAYWQARVPWWVNDLCCVLRTHQRTYKNGSLSPLTPDHTEAIRLVSRAVRAAQRAPAFRIVLAEECHRLRVEQVKLGVEFVDNDLSPWLGRQLLAWLRDRDWSDAKPGAVFQ